MTSPRAIEAAKAIDFAKEARDLKQALADNAYPAADGSADIDNHAIPIIEATLRNVAERFLAAALAVDGLVLQGWRPIESAPKDGTEVLLNSKTTQYVGGWRRGYYGDPQEHEVGWRASCCGRWTTPTHWQPLPPPPAVSDREERR